MTTRPANTPAQPRIGITGSTGQIGGMVARSLADRGIPLTLLGAHPLARTRP